MQLIRITGSIERARTRIAMTKSAATSVRTARKAAVVSPAVTAHKVIAKAARKRAVLRPAPHALDSLRTIRPAVRSPRAAAAAQPSLRFLYPESLRTKAHALLEALEAAPAHPGHAEAMAQVVSELVEVGMDYYFMRALRQADVGLVAEQTARVGMSGAVTLINSMSRKYIVRMGGAQLLVVARHIRELG